MERNGDGRPHDTQESGRGREQLAVALAERLIVKHQNDIDAALLEWRQEISKAPEMVPAICDAFFHKTVREFDANVTRGRDEE